MDQSGHSCGSWIDQERASESWLGCWMCVNLVGIEDSPGQDCHFNVKLLGWGRGRAGDMDKDQFGSNPSLEPPQALHFEQALGQDWNKILMHSWRKIIFKSDICCASVPGGPLMRCMWSRSDHLTRIEWRWSCSVILPCSSTWNLIAEVSLGTWLKADHRVLTPAAWEVSWEQSGGIEKQSGELKERPKWRQLQWRDNKQGDDHLPILVVAGGWGEGCSHLSVGQDINHIIFSMCSYSGCPGGSSPLGFSLPCWLRVPASLVAVFLLRDVWGTKRQTRGHSSTGFHSTLVILQEFISVHGCSIVLIIVLVSYGYILDYHKFSGLKQRKWISLGWHWGVSRVVFLSGTILGDNPFPYLLHLLEAACIAGFMPPSNFKANNGWVSLSHILSLWHSSAFLFCI